MSCMGVPYLLRDRVLEVTWLLLDLGPWLELGWTAPVNLADWSSMPELCSSVSSDMHAQRQNQRHHCSGADTWPIHCIRHAAHPALAVLVEQGDVLDKSEMVHIRTNIHWYKIFT